MVLPAHTSHLLQPLDRGVFSSFKSHLREKLDYTGADTMEKQRSAIIKAMKTAFYHAMEPSCVASSFKTTGIHPLDPNRVLSDKVLITPDVPNEVQTQSTARININGTILTTTSILEQCRTREAEKVRTRATKKNLVSETVIQTQNS